MALRGGSFGRWVGLESRALMNEISALIIVTLERWLTPSTMWSYSEKTVTYEEGVLSKHCICSRLDLGIPASWTGKTIPVAYKPSSQSYFVIVAQVQWVTVLIVYWGLLGPLWPVLLTTLLLQHLHSVPPMSNIGTGHFLFLWSFLLPCCPLPTSSSHVDLRPISWTFQVGSGLWAFAFVAPFSWSVLLSHLYMPESFFMFEFNFHDQKTFSLRPSPNKTGLLQPAH